ncbi:MAG: dephospho-CoA kinase [Pirellula sp.]|jgi:dephospho-CoA kinase
MSALSSEIADAPKKLIVGVLGGIASGKSLVTQWLEELGATVLVADGIAHDILRQEEVVKEVVRRFGESVLADHERPQIDRKKLAALVFGSSEHHVAKRSQLEAIVQPRVRIELQKQIDQWKATHHSGVLVLDIPLLIERDWVKQCDCVLMVDTPDAMRREFAAARGWSESQLAAREATQLSIAEKRKNATFILVNDGTQEQLWDKVQQWWMEQGIDRA